jgi:hypothetical protein
MGTNFYRIPTEEEMNVRKELLIKRINEMPLSPDNIERNFQSIVLDNIPKNIPPPDYFDAVSPWDEFLNDVKVHLGKRSGGWKFTWNFHNDKYYSNKEELLKFIRNGRIVDEYGDEMEIEEFIEMALNWGQPDGNIFNEEYAQTHPSKIIDGLVVSAHTDFC